MKPYRQLNEAELRASLRRPDPDAVAELEQLARAGRLSRRELIQRGVALGLATPAIAGILAACGSSASSSSSSSAATSGTGSSSSTSSASTSSTSSAAAGGGTPSTSTGSGSSTGSSGGKKGGSGTLVTSISGDPKSFNPDFQVDDNGSLVHDNLYNMMVTLDEKYNIIPELAKEWRVADDGLSITFTLASGAKWHDGQPVSSADCKYTIDQILATASAPGHDNLTAISSVDTPDDTTVVFKLKQPSAPLLGFLGWYATEILPKHVYDGTDWTTNPANQKPIGSGPFKFDSYKSGDNVTMLGNMDYWGEGPYLDKLVVRILPDANTALQSFLNNELDVLQSPTPPLSQVAQLQQTDGVKVQIQTYPSVYYLGCNTKTGPMSKLAVRKAIAQAINRDQIVSKALNGFGNAATTFYTDVIAWAADKNPDAAPPAYDAKAAAAGLDAAGYPVKGGSRFKLTFPYFTGSSQYGDIAAVIKQQLKEIDVDVELVALEIGAWQDRTQKGDYDISLLDGFQGPDPANLKLRVGTGGSVNFWFYSNPTVDKLLDEGEQSNDRATRQQKYYAVQVQLAKDLPIIPLSGVKSPRAYHDNVSGLSFTEGLGKVGLNRFTLAKLSK